MLNRAFLTSVGLFLFFPSAFAVDYSALTSSVDVGAVATSLVAIAALMITVVVARWGIIKILSFFDDRSWDRAYQEDEARNERIRSKYGD